MRGGVVGGARRRAVVGVGLLLATGGCGFVSCEADTVPDPLYCSNAPSEAAIDEIALATGPMDPARPLADGDPTYVVIGGQGSRMISLRAMWRGSDAPACGRARLHLRDASDGRELDAEELLLASTPSGGFRVSSDIFFVVDRWPETIDVELVVYGLSLTRRLTVGGYQAPDAGPPADVDAGLSDAGLSDAGLSDAGLSDAGAVDAGTP